MDLFDLGGRAFRSRLRRELPKWQAEGVLGEEAAAGLVRRYRLDEEGVSVAAAAIYTLGALLVGGGVISFVAWNWDHLGRAAKLALLFAALLGAHGAGYWMWRVAGRLPKLGHAFVLLGTLIFGANIGLIAQIFHISPEAGTGIGLWAIGAAAAAWSLASLPNAVLAVVLAAAWGCNRVSETRTLAALAPYAVAAPFLPLAWRLRSRLLFLFVAVATLYTMGWVAAAETRELVSYLGGVGAGALLLMAFACIAREGSASAHFSPAAERIGLLTAVAVLFVCSFHDVADEASWRELHGDPLSWLGFALPAALLALVLLGAGGWRSLPGRTAVLSATAGLVLLACALALPDPEAAGAIVSNAALAAIVISAVTSSVRTLERAPFWAGSVLGVALILARFVEFETELWLKAIVFVLCGAAVIRFGVVFERRRRAARGGGHA